MEESALRPKHLNIGITGSGDYSIAPFPGVYISDALSQNILYHCYEDAHTVEELSKLCGVPAYYIEERMQNLIERQAVLESAKGKYRTDFIIWSDKYGIYCEENAVKILMPMMDKLLDAVDNIAKETNQLDFYKAGKSESDLYFLYGAVAFNHFLQDRYSHLNIPSPKMPERYDGNHWRYVGFMETGKHSNIMIHTQINANMGVNEGYRHMVLGNFAGFAKGTMMMDTHLKACHDILSTGTSGDAVAVAEAIQTRQIIRRDNGEFYVTVPAFDTASKIAFFDIIDKYMAPLAEDYFRLVNKFVDGYKKLFPKHLNDDAERACNHMAFFLFATVAEYAIRTGRIEPPTAGSTCEVLMQK